jgi:hypothetical protein
MNVQNELKWDEYIEWVEKIAVIFLPLLIGGLDRQEFKFAIDEFVVG